MGMMLASTITVFTVHAPGIPWLGYVKPAFPDYAPSGMPDFDERQDLWGPGPGTYTWCGPVAVANSLWWLDSEYESMLNSNPVSPPTISDHFALVPAFGPWDDHDPRNVDPLVHALASLMDTDGMVSHDGHVGTRWPDLESGIKKYLAAQNLTALFEVHNNTFPDFAWIDNETEKCQDVEIFLEFYQLTGLIWTNSSITNPSLENGHFVTCAGADATVNPGELLISDPLQDAFETGTAPMGGRSPVAHPFPHANTVHNDTQYVSQDAYQVALWMGPPGPYGPLQPVYELVGYLQTMGYNPSFHAFIRAAVATSATGVHDVAVTNVKTSKDGCKPMPTVPDNSFARVNVTVLNEGNFSETFNVTLFANATVVDTQTVVGLAPSAQTELAYKWNTTGWAHGNYTISAYATPVPSEVNIADNTFIDGTVKVVIPGDIKGDGIVDIYDAILLAAAYNSVPGQPNWSPNADLKTDDIIDIYDAIVLASHFNQHE
jgi:hypothetical protein